MEQAESKPWLTSTADNFPSWVRTGGWQWNPHTSVWQSSSPDGYLTPPQTRQEYGTMLKHQLDLAAVNSREIASEKNSLQHFGLQMLAMEAWETGSIAVLHPQHWGADTLLIPAATIDYNLCFDALTRFARWLGLTGDEVFLCTAVCNLPHRR